jgi:hypothetical protein
MQSSISTGVEAPSFPRACVGIAKTPSRSTSGVFSAGGESRQEQGEAQKNYAILNT